MQISIHARPYALSPILPSRPDLCAAYCQLAKAVYRRLDFEKWYQAGYWDDKYIPYVLFDGELAVSSVAVCVNDVLWRGEHKTYAQLSTVMTLPEYRNRGLNRWLMEYVLDEWRDKCDAVYLLANDGVVGFYPKFGFEEFTEYDFTMPVRKTTGEYRRLDINSSADLDLLTKMYAVSNPFTDLHVLNFSQFMFHCLHFVTDDICHVEQYNAAAIVQREGSRLICYDVYTDSGASLGEILGVLADEQTEYAYLGFTPKACENCSAVASQEEDNHLFVLEGKDNIFKTDKIMFPLLSRA